MFFPFGGGLNGDDYFPNEDMFGEWEDRYMPPQYDTSEGERQAYRSMKIPKPKHVLKCKHCGATNVYWNQYPSGKWFLYTMGSKEPHKCPTQKG